VKVLTAEASKQTEAVARFLAEARAVNAIRHRGIVDIFNFGTAPNGAQYFVMELLEGMPFDEVIRHRAPVPPVDALRWIDEVLDALDAAHSAGVIHRDIKPSNLFLGDTGRGTPYVKLLDFGIAKLTPMRGGNATPQTNVNAVVGTPDYMAPEQARGQPISGLTDVYALGCVLYELLTGQRIFVANGAMEVMFAHVERKPDPPSKHVKTIPAAVDQLVLHLVAKKPDDRPKTALAAREEIHAVFRKIGAAGSLPAPSNRSLAAVKPAPISNSNATVSSPLAESETELSVPSTESAVKGLGRGRNPIIPAVAAALVVLAAAAYFLWPAPPPVVTELLPPPEPTVTDAAVVEVPPAVVEEPPPTVVEAPPAFVDAGAPPPPTVAAVKPAPPKKDNLGARLAKLKAQLDERDKKKGEKDRILHRLLDGAEKDLQAAKTAEDRKAVAAQLDDLQAQLKQ
jgi:serine/threonine-protein kinase